MASLKGKYQLKAVPGYSATTPGIQLGSTISTETPEDELEFLAQLGIEWVMVNVTDDELNTADGYRAIVAKFAKYGLKVYRIANHQVHNMDAVTLGLPDRDEKIEEFLSFLEHIAAAGLRYHTYAHMANGIWSSPDRSGRAGAQGRTWDPATAVGRWRDRSWDAELTHGREYSEDELWAHYEYFIARVAPVAERLGIFIGIHPDDPPAVTLGGIPRCIFGSFEGYRRAISMADSPNIGVCLCVGCWLEGGESMGKNVVETIEYFAGIGKLFKVHFRNVTNPMPEPWTETFLDGGYMDMHRVMQALRSAGYDGCVIPDYIPGTSAGRIGGLGYSLGYMKALIGAVNNEAADGAIQASPTAAQLQDNP